MLKDSDIKYYEIARKPRPIWQKIGLWAGFFVLAFSCISSLYLAQKFGDLAGLNLSELFSLWANGRPAQSTYSSIEYMALSRLNWAMFTVTFTLMLAIYAIAQVCCIWPRERRVAEALAKAGVIPHGV